MRPRHLPLPLGPRPRAAALLTALLAFTLGLSAARWGPSLPSLPSLKARWKSVAAHPLDRRGQLDHQWARLLYRLDVRGDQFLFDAVGGLLNRPGLDHVWKWPEAAEGRVRLRTNNLGLRESGFTRLEKPGPRVLVAGDSHTAGLVSNRDSFANVAEAILRGRRAGRPGEPHSSLEVLNAGVAYTGPDGYLARLRKYLPLEPDVFVAVLFVGNDFWDALRIRYHLDGWTPPSGSEAYHRRIRSAAERWSGPIYQGFNQAYRWKHFPWERERAVKAVLDAFLQMQRICEAEGIELLCMLLPTKMDVDGDDHLAVREAVRTSLGLDPADVGVNLELGRRVLERLTRSGVRCLDPTEAMRSEAQPLYWRSDYHLGERGHALLGELLARELEELLPAPYHVRADSRPDVRIAAF